MSQLGENASEIEALDLLHAAADRDPQAVRTFYRHYVAQIHRHVVRILGPHDPDSEDVMQQVFLAALDGAARFEGRSKVSTWLLGIATRRAIDHVRARSRRNRWQRFTERVGLGRPESAPDRRHATLSVAHAALEQLSADQRAVFVLSQVEGYTLAEISEMTGTGISTLHARLVAAKKRLDAIVSREGADDERAA